MWWVPVLYTAGVFLAALSLGMAIAFRVARKKGSISSTADVLRLLGSGALSRIPRKKSPGEEPPPSVPPPPEKKAPR
ncbi:MAG TPA: hypothetical protein PK393_08465 [Synergistaceae bacterium]|nr:hypothetical protein [Synergistaceae bacterium]HQH78868.1 hypothetical protein [Synergistaceae bacterium]HQK25536.1 hypothetical protein [Synergistaceae bacterium]